jgi:hypothetical protein
VGKASDKIGRNAPCPCGSGKKFKHCHLNSAIPASSILASGDRNDLGINELKEAMQRPIPVGQLIGPQVVFNGERLRAVRNVLHRRPLKETFTEFLLHHLKWALGKNWHDYQMALPPNQRHQIMLWYRALNEHYREVVQNSSNKTPDGRFGAFPTGDVLALLSLAFDVYILRQQGNLPSKLLDRLRSKHQFQGARYEIAVAATFVRAGFEIQFLDEKVDKRGEFVARHPVLGDNIEVEAKSRHRAGILGQPGNADEVKAMRADVENLVNDAISHNPGDKPFLIFVDLNTPGQRGVPIVDLPWFQDIGTMLQSLAEPTPENPDSCNGIIFTNVSFHWSGKNQAAGGGHVSIIPVYTVYPLRPQTLAAIEKSVQDYGLIPQD